MDPLRKYYPGPGPLSGIRGFQERKRPIPQYLGCTSRTNDYPPHPQNLIFPETCTCSVFNPRLRMRDMSVFELQHPAPSLPQCRSHEHHLSHLSLLLELLESKAPGSSPRAPKHREPTDHVATSLGTKFHVDKESVVDIPFGDIARSC